MIGKVEGETFNAFRDCTEYKEVGHSRVAIVAVKLSEGRKVGEVEVSRNQGQ